MKTWKAVALGAAAAATAPATVPIVLAMLRPLVKVVTKQALVGYELVRMRLAFATEELEDAIAEARAEAEEAIESRRRARAPSQAQAADEANGVVTGDKPS